MLRLSFMYACAETLRSLTMKTTEKWQMCVPILVFSRSPSLRSLELEGVKLTMDYQSLPALEALSITELDMTSSDYSFPVQQAALNSPSLRQVRIGGYPQAVFARQSSAALLLQQLRRASKRRTPKSWRMWKQVPLVIRSVQDPVSIPNPEKTGIFVSLVRQ